MRVSKDTEERRDEFVEAAEKLFRKNGVVDTTVNAIVKEMDVAKGLFYYYFKSKDDVIDAISEKYNKDFKKAIERSLNQDDYSERLDQFIDSSVQSFHTMWTKLRGDSDDIDLTILANRSMDEAKKTASNALEKLLEEGNKAQKLDVRSPKYYAEMIVSGIADLASKSEATPEDIQKLIKELIRNFGKEKNN